MQAIGKVIYATLIADDDTAAIVGGDVFPADAVPEATEAPFETYQVDQDVPDTDLDGTEDGRFADISISFVALTYAQCVAMRVAAAAALRNLTGTIAGIVVTGSQVDSGNDEPQGPIDLDDQQVFMGGLSLTVAYE